MNTRALYAVLATKWNRKLTAADREAWAQKAPDGYTAFNWFLKSKGK